LLKPRRLASKLGALVLVELMLKGRDGIGRYAAQSLLVHADGGSPDPAVGCAEHQDMAAGVTGAPNSDPCCIDFGQRFQKRDRPSPIGDLAPGIDVVSNGPIARTEISMVMDERDETGLGESACEALESSSFTPA